MIPALRSLFVVPSVFAAGVVSLEAASISLNISSGFLFGSAGVTVADRLPVSTLCVLVADMDGNGFDPVPAGAFVGGGDQLITITDLEHDVSLGGTRAFDLSAAGGGTPGFFSRTINIDLAQFGVRTEAVPVALRWFPTLSAVSDFTPMMSLQGTPYGEFSRAVPAYPNTDSWILQLNGGAIFDLDPLATSEFGGNDAEALAMATYVVVPEPGVAGLAVLGVVAGWRRRVRRG